MNYAIIGFGAVGQALARMFAKGKAEGREVRGISDHKFIRSIYFRDPNGYVIELTAKVAGHERDMDPTANHARDILNAFGHGYARRRPKHRHRCRYHPNPHHLHHRTAELPN